MKVLPVTRRRQQVAKGRLRETIKLGLYLGTSPNSGGMFQYSLSILDALLRMRDGRCQVLVAYESADWEPYLEVRRVNAVKLNRKGLGWLWGRLCLPLFLWKRVFSRIDTTARFFSKSQMDYWLFPAQDHWTYLCPLPAIGVVHDLMHRYEPRFPEVSNWGRYWLRQYRFRNICRSARIVLVDSRIGLRHVMESYGVPVARIRPLQYVAPTYGYARSTPADFDDRFSLPPKFLFYPAQFWRHKNHTGLLRAVARLQAGYPDIRLVLTGGRRYEYEDVVREVKQLGLQDAVTFLGYVPDAYLPELYRRARALVMPTFFGPTNIPPLEAQAQGCAVVVSDVYGMSELLGDSACYINPGSEESIAEGIEKIWNDDVYHASLRKKGLRRTRQWTPDHFSARLDEILRALRR